MSSSKGDDHLPILNEMEEFEEEEACPLLFQKPNNKKKTQDV